jgi:hypothetical protein
MHFCKLSEDYVTAWHPSHIDLRQWLLHIKLKTWIGLQFKIGWQTGGHYMNGQAERMNRQVKKSAQKHTRSKNMFIQFRQF